MMICDSERPVGAAGVMGGLDTEVTASTTRMLLEAAHFVNTSVRRTRKQMGLSTEASYRFERSVDPEGVVAAIHRFAQLYAECGGAAKPSGDIIEVFPSPPSPVTLRVRMSRANTLLGMEVSDDAAQRYLEALGFAVERKHQPASSLVAFEVTAPTWRPDIVREDDVIEEIGRVHGFDRIPETLPHGATTRGGQSATEDAIDLIREKLLRAGFHQIVSHTLRDAHPLDAPGERVGPRNPGSPELALLRNSTWPSLAEAAARNGGKNVHLFETGRVFDPVSGERRCLGIYSQGALYPTHRQNDPSPSADFFTLKGVLQTLVPNLRFSPGNDKRLHPTRQAGGTGLGSMGEIHPDIAVVLGLPSGAVLAELDLEALANASLVDPHYRPISRNPSVRRDLAFLVDKSTPYSRIEEALAEACGDVLERLWLFDIYEGKGVPEGQHSLAVALQLRKMGENFTDEEANQVRERAVAALVSLGASPRV
jgi:phenylalanyl-tRNA synthetase beta chain